MTDKKLHTLDILNQLFTAERRSPLPRLAEMGVFVTWALAREIEQVRRMVREEAVHQAWLLEAAEDCGGGLAPAGPDVTTANLHYLDLQAVMPRVLDGLEKLVRLYTDAAQHNHLLTPLAAETIRRIAIRHQAHLDQFRDIYARVTASGSPT